MCFTKWWTLLYPFVWMTELFHDVPFIPKPKLSLFTIEPYKLWYVPKRNIFWSTAQLFQSFLAAFPTFLKRYSWHYIQNEQMFTKIHKDDEVKYLIVGFLCFEGIGKWSHSVLLIFLYSIPVFWELRKYSYRPCQFIPCGRVCRRVSYHYQKCPKSPHMKLEETAPVSPQHLLTSTVWGRQRGVGHDEIAMSANL